MIQKLRYYVVLFILFDSILANEDNHRLFMNEFHDIILILGMDKRKE